MSDTVRSRVVELREAGTCDECSDPECGMVLVEVQGGEHDGARAWVGACKLTPPGEGTPK